MRASEPGELLKMIVALLEHQVLPAVTTSSARSTLLLIVGMVDNLAERVEERRELVQRDRELVDGLLAVLPRRLGDVPSSQHEVDAGVDRGTPMSELVRVLRSLVDSDALDDAELSAWLVQCHEALGRHNKHEVELLNPTRYLKSQNA